MSSYDTYSDPAPRVRPGALTLICVLAIVFGALGLLSGCIGLISQLASSTIQQSITAGQAGASGEAAELQREFLSKTMAITAKYNAAMIPLTVLKILVDITLLIGGIMALGMKPTGRSLLSKALLGALIVESILYVPTFMIQREAQAVAAQYMPKIMAAQGANAAPPGLDMSTMMSGIGTVTLAFGVIWLVAKIVLYILGLRYLATPKMDVLFSGSGSSGRA